MSTSKYKVLLTTSGTGSRLGDITQYTNKSLVNVGGRAAIDYIIEAYPEDTEFVITVGYMGDLVRQYLELAYPNRSIELVPVDPYEGPGSSLVYSMFQAKDSLQCPFIFHSCDTLVPTVTMGAAKNWVGINGTLDGYNGGSYRTVEVANGRISIIHEKGVRGSGAYIGLVGINDYTVFWEVAEALLESNPSWLSDANVVERMLESGYKFKALEVSAWLDTGNVGSLENARANIWGVDKPLVLEKPGQSVYVREKDVIKFFSDPKMVSSRVERAKNLGAAAPAILGSTQNFFSYAKFEGRLFTDRISPEEFLEFLQWCGRNIWNSIVPTSPDLEKVAHSFYYEKTLARLELAHRKLNIQDRGEFINEVWVPSIEELLQRLQEVPILGGPFVRGFHGDLHNSNIFSMDKTWGLIDWREDFGGRQDCGDIYYDLAKLNHGLIVSHDLVEKGHYIINSVEDSVTVDILRKDSLVGCQRTLEQFVQECYLDWHKVQLITALIYLNISPLHHAPYDRFLYYYGKHMLGDLLSD